MKVYPLLRLLIVGMNGQSELALFMGLMKKLEAKDIEWRYGCRRVDSFKTALAMLAGCISLEMVHVHRGESYTSLARDCQALAQTLSMHPRNPWLNLNGAGFNFLRPVLRGHPHVRIDNFENTVAERWEFFGPHRLIGKQA